MNSVCVCIFVIDIIRLNDIKVASFFLVLIFSYNAFFNIFATLSVLFAGDLQTNQQASNIIDDLCEKYSSSALCIQQSIPYPMMLSVPLINDYRGGSAELGLPEVIFPGFLISFFARLDASKKLLSSLAMRRRAARRGITTNVSEYFQTHSRRRSAKKRFFSGYFTWVATSYAIGLFIVYLFKAFMNREVQMFFILTPIMLVTIFCLAMKKKDVGNIWDNQEALYMATRGKGSSNSFPLFMCDSIFSSQIQR